MTGLCLEDRTSDIMPVLRNLSGDVTAEYRALPVEMLPEALREVLTKEREGNHASNYGITLIFSEDPKTPNIIKQVIVHQGDKRELAKAFRTANAKSAIDICLAILSLADSISSRNGLYEDNDQNKSLINEDWHIVQASKGDYSWSYALSSPHGNGLPLSVLSYVRPLFDHMQRRFTPATFHRVTFERMDRNAAYGRDERDR